MEPFQMKTSILESVIANSFSYDPANAHMRILTYILDSDTNISTDEVDLFKRCWARTLLTYEAFGQIRKGDESYDHINPQQFARDFIDELCKNDKSLSHITRTAEKLRKEYYDIVTAAKNQAAMQSKTSRPRDFGDDSEFGEIRRKHQIENLKQDIKNYEIVQNNIKATFLGESMGIGLSSNHISSSTEDESNEEAASVQAFLNQIQHFRDIHSLQLRDAMQYYRIHNVPHDPTHDIYVPILRDFYGISNCEYGELKLKATASQDSKVKDIAKPCERVIDITIAASVNVEDRNWVIYSALYDMLLYPPLNIFPKPINTKQNKIAPYSRIFTYEYHSSVRRLVDMISTSLATLLRSHPNIFLTWLRQLCLARMSLLTSEYEIDRDMMTVQDIYVRSDGLLLIGNVCIKEIGDESVDLSGFDELAFKILSESLALSREFKLPFPKISGNKDIDIDQIFEKSLILTERQEIQLLLPARESSFQIIIVEDMKDIPAIATSPTIYIHKRDDYDISENMRTRLGDTYVSTARLKSTKPIIDLEVIHPSTSTTYALKLNPSEGRSQSTTFIKVSGMNSGSAMVSLICFQTNQPRPYHVYDISIDILPAKPIPSCEMMEVLSVMEVGYMNRNPSIIWTSFDGIVNKRTVKYVQDDQYSNDADDIAEEWRKMIRSMDDLL